MTEKVEESIPTITLESARFGVLTVPADSVLEFPSGLIGFPGQKRYVLIEHKAPFSWLHSVDEASLAFVVVDGFDLGQQYDVSLPFSYAECGFQESDEYAILVIVTVRSDPKATTANVKAPLFVNVRTRLGVQVIYDDPQLSTRVPLWKSESSPGILEAERIAAHIVGGESIQEGVPLSETTDEKDSPIK